MRGKVWITIGALFAFVLATEAARAANPALNQAIAAYNQGKYIESLGLFNKAKSTDSDNPLLHYYMASALVKINQKPDAIREYKLTMALDPGGNLGKLAETSLNALEGAKAAVPTATSKLTPATKVPNAATKSQGAADPSGGRLPYVPGRANSEPPRADKVRADQTPQVVALLCGCPKCQQLELLMTDLYTKYADKIEFVRLMQSSKDPATLAMVKKYSLSTCPTILLVSNTGEPAREFLNLISDRDVTREVELLAKNSRTNRLKSVAEQKMAEQRKLIVDEVDARVSHDELRVNNSIRQIQTDLANDIQSLQIRDTREKEAAIEVMNKEAQRKQDFLKQDFERRKKEYYAAAEARINGLQSTGGASATPFKMNRDFSK